MQQQPPTPTPPALPAAPRVAAPPGVVVTRQDLAALRARWTELGNQLRTLESTRNRISEQLSRTGDAAARSGLLERVSDLDKRMMQLDAERADVGRQIATAAPELSTTTVPPPPTPIRGGPPDNEIFVIIPALLIIFVIFPLVLAYTRRIWKRTPSGPAIPREWNDVPQRLERLEHAIDVVAIEVERVSEGQRFVTRLMTENQLGPAVAAVRASADAARDVAAQPLEPERKALGAGERPFEPVRAVEHEEAQLRGRK